MGVNILGRTFLHLKQQGIKSDDVEDIPRWAGKGACAEERFRKEKVRPSCQHKGVQA